MKKRLYAAAFIAVLCVLLLSGCCSIFENTDADILVVSDALSSYDEVIASALPALSISATKPGNLPSALETNAMAVEAFDTQAYGYLQSGAAEYFYPHYLATVVIAVDRERVTDEIAGWHDLLRGAYKITLPGYQYCRYAVLAMSAGLDAGTFDMTNALNLIRKLYTVDRIVSASSDTGGIVTVADFEAVPVAVMFDFEAANLIKMGRNIEIIVPQEGTLSFSGGLLSDTALKLDISSLNTLLLDAGFRLADGRCDASLYPLDYSAARSVTNAESFNLASQDVSARLRREGRGSFMWATADGDEHTVSFLVFFIGVILWGGAVYMRTLHKGIRRSMLAIILLLVLRVALRYIKTLFGEDLFAARFIWYCYYIPLLLLPVCCLWMAWVIDKPEGETGTPRWWWAVLAAGSALIALTLTNDLHQLMFTFQPGFMSWTRSHGFGIGYYLFLTFFVLCAVCCVVLLIRKAGRSGAAGLIPLGVILLLGGAFIVSDFAGVPFVAQMQTPFVSAVLLLMFFEVALRTGFIPSNSKYGRLFAKAPLDMKILKSDGTVFCATEYSVTGTYSEYRTDIRGGSTVLRVDLSGLNDLERSLEAKLREITQRNELLRREQRLKDELLTLQIQNRLYDEVEATVSEKVQQIADIIATIPHNTDPAATWEKIARAAVLMSYVKCRSNLLLTGKVFNTMSLFDLSQFTRDSAESAKAAGINCAVYMKGEEVPFRIGVLAYDLYEHFLECALRYAPCDMTLRHDVGNTALRLSVLVSTSEGSEPDDRYFTPEGKLLEEVNKFNGSFRMTVEDETLVANAVLPFGKGGGAGG